MPSFPSLPGRALIGRTSLVLCLALAGSAPLAAQCANVSQPWGSGCGPTTPWGIPTLSCTGAPGIGNASFGFTATAPCVASAGFLLVGTCRSSPHVFTSGFGSGGLCGPSQAVCALFVDAVTTLTGTAQSGGFAWAVPIPNAPHLVGLRLCVQNANLCSTVPCISASQGVSVTLL